MTFDLSLNRKGGICVGGDRELQTRLRRQSFVASTMAIVYTGEG